jgi:hypothetical protein
MLSESAFLGLGEQNQQVQELVQIFQHRFTHYFKTNKTKYHLFTKRGLMDFVNTGLLSDHYKFLRPFNCHERKTILEFLINQTETNSYCRINLLKNDYAIENFKFCYFENKTLYIIESSSGYGEDYFGVAIDSIPVIDIFDDFIKNELLKYHVYTENETLEYLKYLLTIIPSGY